MDEHPPLSFRRGCIGIAVVATLVVLLSIASYNDACILISNLLRF